MQIGTALNYGNVNDRITIQLLNGKIVNAIASNEINSSKVFVIQLEQEYFAWSETPPQTVLQKSEGIQIIPKELAVIEEEQILPFQVLFSPNSQLGGDRNQLILYSSENIIKGGINNVGQQQYIAVWQEPGQIIRDANGSQAIIPIPNLDYSWLGFGILGAVVHPQIPEANRTTSTEGENLPFDFDVPLYPIFYERSYQDREGVTTTEQEEEGYSYSQIETYNYRHIKGGNSLDPTPSIFSLNVVCNFTTSGAFETQTYSRETRCSYLKTISETLEKPIEVWFNGTLYQGNRTETYTETYDYQLTPALFNTSTSFRCTLLGGDPLFGFYQWQEVSNTSANWSGETTTLDRTYTKTISEPEWQRPITPSYSRPQHHSYNNQTTETIYYPVPSETWSVPVGSFFLFEVPATETQTITSTITESYTTVTPLLLSGDGNSALFKETQSTLDKQFTSNRDRSIPKFLRDNSTEFPTATSHTETTIVEKTETETFSLYNNGVISTINTEDAWVFKVKTTQTLSLGSLTLSNDDDTPILKAKINRAVSQSEAASQIAYRKEENKVAETIEYFDSQLIPVPWWDTIEFRPIYAFSGDKRYRGVLLSYSYEDEPDEQISIEIMRSVLSITLDLEEVEFYPVGLAEPGEIVIVPQDNCAVLLRDILLSVENKIYCNLINDLLFFAKSVENNLEASEQITEVYSIGFTVIQDAPEQGIFIPITGAETVLGISYFPI